MEKICSECGETIDANLSTCPNCGFPFHLEDEGEGKGILMRCPECGKDTYSERAYCKECGFPVRDYLEKKNKTTFSDVLDSLSITSIRGYFDYVINEARNTIKVMFFSVLLSVIGIIVSIFQILSCRTKIEKEKIYIQKETLAAVVENHKEYIQHYSNQIVICSILTVVCVGIIIIFSRKLVKDYFD